MGVFYYFFWDFYFFSATLLSMTCSLKDLSEKTSVRVVGLQGKERDIQSLMGRGIRSSMFITLIKTLFFRNNYVIEAGGEYFVLRKHEAQCLQVTTSA